jgi:hypothetical protein
LLGPTITTRTVTARVGVAEQAPHSRSRIELPSAVSDPTMTTTGKKLALFSSARSLSNRATVSMSPSTKRPALESGVRMSTPESSAPLSLVGRTR